MSPGTEQALVAGVVLAGGASRRMGRDKALIAVDGIPMVVRVASVLRDAGCDPVAVVGGDTDALGALGLTVVPDEHPGAGPLGGIITALRWASGPVIVTACDLPHLDPVTVRAVIAAPPAEVAVATTDRVEPLLARWDHSALTALTAAHDAGERAVHVALAHLRWVGVHVQPEALRNVNTPGDLRVPITADSLPRMPIREVSVDDLAAALEQGARVIDVRELHEYLEAHVPGAVLVPLGTVPEQVDAFRGDGPTYVICRSGARSMRACDHVADHGIEVVNVAGGTLAWIDSGRDVVTGDQPA